MTDMVKAEQFIHGLFNGVGIHTVHSPHVTDLVSTRTLQYLYDLTQSQQLLLPHDQVIAISQVHEVKDEFGRTGYRNHTILIPFDDYCALTQPKRYVEQHFLQDLTQPPSTLKTLDVNHP